MVQKNNKIWDVNVDNTVISNLIETILSIWLDILPVYDFHLLNVPEDGVECESLTIISSDSLLNYENRYLQVYLDNCTYKIVDKQFTKLSWWQSFWNWWRLIFWFREIGLINVVVW